ncbi:MAG: HIT family protein [Azoarcus sp.]|jgi:diadenosine tetraphosphate (Ap4A) HIT family hydrolase|nr:HIT family protein [Azoarcus sp.]
MECPLCVADRDDLIWQDGHCHVIAANDTAYPGYFRVVWKEHIAEMSDLGIFARHHFMDVVFAVESSLRALMNPDKINLASLGNQVPHLHWHVIARFADDRHFPESIWALEQRRAPARAAPERVALAARIDAELARISIAR